MEKATCFYCENLFDSAAAHFDGRLHFCSHECMEIYHAPPQHECVSWNLKGECLQCGCKTLDWADVEAGDE